MTYNTGEKHLVEIDHVSVLETIDEKFDGITSLLTQNAVMYGSTVTALIAKLPIVGDLDISVSEQEYGDLTRRIASSVKWVQVDGPNVSESGLRISTTGGLSTSWGSPKDKYRNAKQLPISKIVSFRNVNDAKVQIMEARGTTGDSLEDALSIVRKVDFVFCGMALDRYGRMLEIVPHAYNDCVQRIIRVEDYQPQVDPKQLRHRITKYVRRGWSLTLSIDQAMMNLDVAKRAYLKRIADKPPRKFKKHKSMAGLRVRAHFSKGVVIEISAGLKRALGCSINDIVNSFSAKHYNIGMKSINNKDGSTQCYQVIDKASTPKITFQQAKVITKEVSRYIKERYNVDSSMVIDADRKAASWKSFGLKKPSYSGSIRT